MIIFNCWIVNLLFFVKDQPKTWKYIMDVEETQGAKPDITINITNIKETIPRPAQADIINTNMSTTSTPEKIFSSQIISSDALLTLSG